MHTSNQATRTPFTLFDLAHVVGGKLVQVHHNACPALVTEHPEDCRCGEVDYRLVSTSEGKRR